MKGITLALPAPYVGLRPFTEQEALLFFGREPHVRALLTKLEGQQRFIAVLGASGTGKSSLVRAGLVPALRRGALASAGYRWNVCICEPGDAPLTNLAQVLVADRRWQDSDDTADAVASLSAALAMSPLALTEVYRQKADVFGNEALLLVVDQFEEIFRYRQKDVDEAEAFIKLLLRSACEEAPIYVVMTMRSDFLGKCVAFFGLPEAINRGIYLTPRLGPDQLKSVIASPLRLVGSEIDPVLVNNLVNTLEAEDELPILQHALARTWDTARRTHPDSPAITRSDIDAIGGVAGALHRHAETIWAGLPAKDQAAGEHLFRSITERSGAGAGEEGRYIRRPQPLKQIAATATPAWQWQDFEPVVKAFADPEVNFLRYKPPLNNETLIDISHEALIRHWQTLRKWADDEGRRADEYRRWREEYRRWRDRTSGLLMDRALDRALAWRAGDGRWQPTPQWAVRYAEGENDFSKTVDYIEKSRLQAEAIEEQRRRELEARKRQANLVKLLIALFAVGALVSVAYAFYTSQEARLAKQQASLAEQKSKLLDQKEKLAEQKKDLAEQQRQVAEHEKFQSLLRAAAPQVTSEEAAESLAYLAVVLRNEDSSAARSLAVLLLLNRSWPLPATAPLRQHDGPVVFADFSPDGGRLVTASEDGSANIWDVYSGKPLGNRMAHKGPVRSALFSPDGERIVTASDDGTAGLWNAHTGAALAAMTHGAAVGSAVFSPDGTRVLTASDDHTARIWDAHSGAAIGPTLRHDKHVHFAAFNPDGTRVATASEDHTAKIWDARSGSRLLSLQEHQAPVVFIAFSPDDTRILTIALDNTARLWDARSGEPLGKPMEHTKRVRHASFSPDGTRVVTASLDHTARLWDAHSGAALGVPMQHEDAVNSAVFSRDGNSILTASEDRTARYWDGHTGVPAATEPMRQDGAVLLAAFSPDGTSVVTASQDSIAQIWSTPTTPVSPLLIEHPQAVVSARFSPNDAQILTSDDRQAQRWDAHSGARVGEPIPRDSDDSIVAVAFSTDGTRVITASHDTIRVWDAASGSPAGPPLQAGRDSHASLSADNHRLAAVSDDGTFTLWDTDTGKPIGAPIKGVKAAVFSPNGERLITASDDDTARLWDGHSGAALGAPMRPGGPVSIAAFSPDSTRVVTTSGKSAQLWDAASGARIDHPMTHQIDPPMTHQGDVLAAAFSPDGSRIVTASWDRTARLWNGSSGEPIGEIMQHRNVVLQAAFSPDGNRIVTASEDRTARLWDGRSGVSLGDALQFRSAVQSAVFSRDGARLVMASGDLAAVLDAPGLAQEDQTALADLAEAVGGLESSAERAVTTLPDRYQSLVKLRTNSGASPSTGLPALINWFFADPKTRPSSPGRHINVIDSAGSAGSVSK